MCFEYIFFTRYTYARLVSAFFFFFRNGRTNASLYPTVYMQRANRGWDSTWRIITAYNAPWPRIVSCAPKSHARCSISRRERDIGFSWIMQPRLSHGTKQRDVTIAFALQDRQFHLHRDRLVMFLSAEIPKRNRSDRNVLIFARIIDSISS